MQVGQFSLDISYNQFAVFDPSEEQPFNNWTDVQVEQGFSWRSSSVCFHALFGDGSYLFTVNLCLVIPKIDPKSIRAILLPLPRLKGNRLEVSSIGESKTLELVDKPKGLLVQFFPSSSNEGFPVTLDLVVKLSRQFKILKGLR